MSARSEHFYAPVKGLRGDVAELADQLLNLSRLPVRIVGDFGTWAILNSLDLENGAPTIAIRTGLVGRRRPISVIAPAGLTHTQTKLVTKSGPHPTDSRLQGLLNGHPIQGTLGLGDFLQEPIRNFPPELAVGVSRQVGPNVQVVTATALAQGLLLVAGEAKDKDIARYNEFAARALAYAPEDELSVEKVRELSSYVDPIERNSKAA